MWSNGPVYPALDRKAKLQALRRKRDGEVATDIALALCGEEQFLFQQTSRPETKKSTVLSNIFN